MKKILMVLAPENFRDAEYIVPRAFFEQAGVHVETVAESKAALGKFGYRVEIDRLLHECDELEYDGIFFVGGKGSLRYGENPAAKTLTMRFLEHKKPVAAICAAPRNLLAWGILAGKRCTGFNGDGEFERMCGEQGALFTGRPAEVDGPICTGQGPAACEETAIAFLGLLQGNG